MVNLSRGMICNMSDCPKCGAKAGDQCFQKNGKDRRKANHHERMVAAQGVADKLVKQPKARKQKKHKSKAPNRAKKKSNGFYSSWEWKKARYDAIKKYAQRCMCCGWRVGDTEYGYLVVDHIKPRSKFPQLSLDVNNLQILCNDCNMGKSNDSIDDWRDMDEHFKAVTQE